MRLTIIITALTLFGGAAGAQGDERARLQLAREQLRALRERVEALPKPAAPDLRIVPTPTLRAMDLASELREFARLNEDLPLTADAWRLLATTRRADGDVARAATALGRAAECDDDPDRAAADRGAAALLMADFGALERAHEILAGLAETLPAHDLAPEWKKRATALEKQVAEQKQTLDSLAHDFSRPGRRSRALHRAQIFAFRNPMHPESGNLLMRLIGELKDAPVGDKIGYFERIAFYLPQNRQWLPSTRQCLGELTREGHYEKASFYTRLLLERSELLAPGEAAKLSQLDSVLRARLSRIAARRLEVKPPTKDLRYRDLFRRARGGEDPQTLQELVAGFIEDYPECSEIAEARMVCAEAIARDLPEEALAHYQAVAENHPTVDRARDAYAAAASMIEKAEGPDAADAWLKSLGPRYEAADDRARIALLRARILDEAERWEDARTALRAVTPEDPFVKREVEQRLKELDTKIGD